MMDSLSLAEHWDERYRTGNTPWQMTRPSSELMRVVTEDGIAPCAAIDLGCGLGTHSVWLAQQAFDVTGVDVSPLVIARARAQAAEAGVRVRFLAADLLATPDEGGLYDFFFDRGCYHFVRGVDVDRYLQCLRRITRPGSIGLVLAGNAKERNRRPLVSSGRVTISITGPPGVDEASLRGELGSLFEIVRLREFRFDPGDTDPGGWLGWSCLLRRR